MFIAICNCVDSQVKLTNQHTTYITTNNHNNNTFILFERTQKADKSCENHSQPENTVLIPLLILSFHFFGSRLISEFYVTGI